MSHERRVIFDDDNPEWTVADFARARSVDEVPELAALFGKKSGRPVGTTKANAKAAVSLRLDPDILAYFRATGPGWQSKINEYLRKAIA